MIESSRITSIDRLFIGPESVFVFGTSSDHPARSLGPKPLSVWEIDRAGFERLLTEYALEKPRHARVFLLRGRWTLAELADDLGITRQRAHQLWTRATEDLCAQLSEIGQFHGTEREGWPTAQL
jgi:hypothetical protein